MATQATAKVERLPAAADPGRVPSAHAVSAGFRCGYIVKFAVAVACGSLAAGLVACALLASELGTYAQNMTIISGARAWVVGAAAVSALVQIALTGVLVTVLALLASHKVAGPTVRVARALRGVAQGRLPGPVRFRHGDQVGKLESHFNEVSRVLCERHERVERALDRVQSAERDLCRVLGEPAAPEEQRAAARTLRERASELAGLLADIGGATDGGPDD
jgi:hypothetical protein